MDNIVKITNVELENVKNVKNGNFHTKVDFDNLESANLIGLYGQNGSGKTAVVEALGVLKNLISDEKMPEQSEHFIYVGEKSARMTFDFIVLNNEGQFNLKYFVELSEIRDEDSDESKPKLKITKESLSYRENKYRKKFKDIISYDYFGKEKVKVRKSLIEETKFEAALTQRMSYKDSTSFIFKKELRKFLPKMISVTELNLIINLVKDFGFGFHVINDKEHALTMSHVVMPFSIHLKHARGYVPYDLSRQSVVAMPKSMFDDFNAVIKQINVVLTIIVPGLEIKVNNLHSETLENGEEGIRFELLSKKKDVLLPLKCESAGVLKIITILSTLIAVYNYPNVCVVIDELDAGIYEYLLGELLEIINDEGQGQLLFTSHNLRILEVLPVKNLWFTTTNQFDRYHQLKGLKKDNNVRDVYLRAIQLGGQQEELYEQTKTFKIKKSFRKAGSLYDKN